LGFHVKKPSALIRGENTGKIRQHIVRLNGDHIFLFNFSIKHEKEDLLFALLAIKI
jgi:hypothetical protein